MIQAIETVYNGYRFRSRLEARWAVFFDTLGVTYEYEKEGFELGDSMRYLPDFWLPNQDCWVEIKGTMPTPIEREKASRLAATSGKWVFLFHDDIQPLNCIGEDIVGSGLYFAPDGDIDGCMEWGKCPLCGHYGIGLFGHHRKAICSLAVKGDGDESWWSLVYPGTENLLPDASADPSVRAAYITARQARFEFGENGAPRRFMPPPPPIPPVIAWPRVDQPPIQRGSPYWREPSLIPYQPVDPIYPTGMLPVEVTDSRHAQWAQTVLTLKAQNPYLGAFLDKTILIAATSKALLISAPFDYHTQRLNDPKYRTEIEAALLAIFGQAYQAWFIKEGEAI